ncbi:MAG TPA: hypothetical protein VIX86_15260, partial [Streptosporangiaceae bacterium]
MHMGKGQPSRLAGVPGTGGQQAASPNGQPGSGPLPAPRAALRSVPDPSAAMAAEDQRPPEPDQPRPAGSSSLPRRTKQPDRPGIPHRPRPADRPLLPDRLILPGQPVMANPPPPPPPPAPPKPPQPSWPSVLVTTVRLWLRRRLRILWPATAGWRVVMVIALVAVVFAAGAVTVRLVAGRSQAGPSGASPSGAGPSGAVRLGGGGPALAAAAAQQRL